MENIDNTRGLILPEVSDRVKEAINNFKKVDKSSLNVTVSDLIGDGLDRIEGVSVKAARMDADRLNKILESIRNKLVNG